MTRLIFCDYCNKLIQYHSNGVEIEVNTLDNDDYYPSDIVYGIYHLHKQCLKEIRDIALKTPSIMKEGDGSINPMEAQ